MTTEFIVKNDVANINEFFNEVKRRQRDEEEFVVHGSSDKRGLENLKRFMMEAIIEYIDGIHGVTYAPNRPEGQYGRFFPDYFDDMTSLTERLEIVDENNRFPRNMAQLHSAVQEELILTHPGEQSPNTITAIDDLSGGRKKRRKKKTRKKRGAGQGNKNLKDAKKRSLKLRKKRNKIPQDYNIRIKKKRINESMRRNGRYWNEDGDEKPCCSPCEPHGCMSALGCGVDMCSTCDEKFEPTGTKEICELLPWMTRRGGRKKKTLKKRGGRIPLNEVEGINKLDNQNPATQQRVPDVEVLEPEVIIDIEEALNESDLDLSDSDDSDDEEITGGGRRKKKTRKKRGGLDSFPIGMLDQLSQDTVYNNPHKDDLIRRLNHIWNILGEDEEDQEAFKDLIRRNPNSFYQLIIAFIQQAEMDARLAAAAEHHGGRRKKKKTRKKKTRKKKNKKRRTKKKSRKR